MYLRRLTVAVVALGAATALTASAGAAVVITQLAPGSFSYAGALPTSAGVINETVDFTGLIAAGSSFSLTLGGTGTGPFSNLAVNFGGTPFSIVPDNGTATSRFTTMGLNGVAGSSIVLTLTGLLGANAITGVQGFGSYGGTLTVLSAAVPEISTWAMMTLGFGSLGYALRRRRVQFALA